MPNKLITRGQDLFNPKTGAKISFTGANNNVDFTDSSGRKSSFDITKNPALGAVSSDFIPNTIENKRKFGLSSPTDPNQIKRPVLDVGGGKLSINKPTAPDFKSIREQEIARAEAMIRATEGLFQKNLADIQRQGKRDLQEASSIAVGAGLAGSPFKATTEAPVKQLTAQQAQAERSRRQAEITSLLTQGDRIAENRFLRERNQFQDERTAFLNQQRQTKEDTLKIISEAGRQGFDYKDFSLEQKQALKDKTGLDDFGLDIFLNANKPKPEQKDIQYKVIGDKLVGYYTEFDDNGNPSIKTIESPSISGLKADSKIQVFDNIPYVISKDENGNFVGKPLQGFEKPSEDISPLDQAKIDKIKAETDKIQAQLDGGGLSEADRINLEIKKEKLKAEQIKNYNSLSKQEQQKKLVELNADLLVNKLDLVDSIAKSSGLSGAVGSTFLNRENIFNPATIIATFTNAGKRRIFLGKVSKLIDTATIDKLLEVKRANGTFGSLSDKELQLLRNSATELNNWIARDSNDKADSINVSEKDFIKGLNDFKNQTIKSIVTLEGFKDINDLKEQYNKIEKDIPFEEVLKSNSSILDIARQVKQINNPPEQTQPEQTDTNSLEDLLNNNPDLIDKAETLQNKFPDLPPDEIKNLLQEQGFNKEQPLSLNGGARTDRHKNPTAFTTNIAKQAGLKEGVDYVAGDKFPNSNLRTAKLLGDPVDTTIKVIDRIGFFTRGGKQRWTHTAIPKSKWDKMNREQKKNVIKQMYKREGNKGLLNQFFA